MFCVVFLKKVQKTSFLYSRLALVCGKLRKFAFELKKRQYHETSIEVQRCGA